MAFEPLQNHLYWTNNVDKSICRMNVSSAGMRKVEKVISLHADDKPRGIDLDLCKGQLYFTNWNAQKPSIQRAWFSGITYNIFCYFHKIFDFIYLFF